MTEAVPSPGERCPNARRASWAPQPSYGASAMRSTALLIPALALALGACAEPGAPAASASRALLPQDPGSSSYWNGVARGLVAKYNSNALVAIRGYAVLSLAQYNAVVASEQEGPGPKPSVRAALGRASAVALAYV